MRQQETAVGQQIELFTVLHRPAGQRRYRRLTAIIACIRLQRHRVVPITGIHIGTGAQRIGRTTPDARQITLGKAEVAAFRRELLYIAIMMERCDRNAELIQRRRIKMRQRH